MIWFASTIFLSAYLLFFVQPLIARFVLPWFGGSPSVWTTCMLFFQVVLLAGYAYADLLTRCCSRRYQVFIHSVLLVVTLFCLPVVPSESWKPGGDEIPVLQILGLLLSTIGAPYFFLSTTGPLLQAWFAQRFATQSPYRLYALSNAGSLLALIGYPFLFEPLLGTRPQAIYWSWGFAVFVALALITGGFSLIGQRDVNRTASTGHDLIDKPATKVIPRGRRGVWLWLAMLPSVLLLAVTNQLCQDIAVIPFLWIVPLSLYLITFIICFDHPRWYQRSICLPLLIFSAAGVISALCRDVGVSLAFQLTIFPLFFFAAAMVCHGELARLKPETNRLTEYYLMLSLGGALGGILVVIVAPLIFVRFFELHIAIVAVLITAITALTGADDRKSLPILVWIGVLAGLPLAMTIISFSIDDFKTNHWALISFGALWASLSFTTVDVSSARRGQRTSSPGGATAIETAHAPKKPAKGRYVWLGVLSAGLVLLVVYVVAPGWAAEWLMPLFIVVFGAHIILVVQANRIDCPLKTSPAIRLAILFLAIASASGFLLIDAFARRPGLVVESRGFYGLVSIVTEGNDEMPRGRLTELYSGRILHGFQFNNPNFRRLPTSYYGDVSGLGKLILRHPKRLGTRQPMTIGVVGLGAGVVAAWTDDHDRITFFEINKQIDQFAARYFTFLGDTQAETRVVIGDGRLMLEHDMKSDLFQPFDLLVIDAFSGDAIPRHLLTQECFESYVRSLAPDGALAVHATNGYFDLRPVVFASMEQAGLTPKLFVGRTENTNAHVGQQDSVWIIGTRNEQLLSDSEFLRFASDYPEHNRVYWTDDFGSPVQVLLANRPNWWPAKWWPWFEQ